MMNSWNLVLSALVALTLAFIANAGSAVPREDDTSVAPSAGKARDQFMKQILAESSDYGDFHNTSSTKGSEDISVGIIGAGAAGLYAAVLLDSLNIDYEILESSERLGGRVFTYRFNQAAWDASEPGDPDYYDYYVRHRHTRLLEATNS